MANTADEVKRLYDAHKGARAESTIRTSESKLPQLLAEFFGPHEVVLRLNLYKDRINTSRRRGAVPLHAFYLNAPPNDRLAYLFDIPEPEKKRPRTAYDTKKSSLSKTTETK